MFFHLFSLTILNAYILYKESTQSPVLHRIIRRELVKQLITSSGISPSLTLRGRPRRSAEGLTRLQPGYHFPEKIQGTGKKTNITRSCVVCFHAQKKILARTGEKRKRVQFSVHCLQSGLVHPRLLSAVPHCSGLCCCLRS